MENSNKRYWRGLEELRNDEKFVKDARSEFSDGPTESQYESLVDGVGTHRRDFLKVLGFGMAAVSLAACETPVKKAIPYVNKPEGEFPTISNWYASTYSEGGDYASILVKTREGRPIKIEGNSMSNASCGVSARVHASLLGLYDNEKLKGPKKGEDTKVSWESVDKEIADQLANISTKGGAIRIVSSTILSPSTKSVIADFTAKYPTTKHIVYDANSSSAIVKGNELSFGKAVIPTYNFNKAKLIVGIDADFLGTWIAPETYSSLFAETRIVSSSKEGKKDMSRHYQFEAILSLTGSNADYRTAVKPSQLGLVVTTLYNKVAAKLGGKAISAPTVEVANLDKAAAELVSAKGQALVVCGINDPSVQVVVNALNSLLGSYGTTIDIDNPVYFRQGNDAAMNDFIEEVKGGKVDAVIVYGSNPVYDHPRGAELAAALPKVALGISFNDRADETSSLLKYICPAPHYLESWNDAEPKAGFFSLTQPTISLIFSTRQAQTSLLKWAGLQSDFHEYIKAYWRKSIYPQGGTGGFEQFWVKSLHDGVFAGNNVAVASNVTFVGNVDAAAAAIAKKYKTASSGIELAIFENVGIGNGFAANNPWLQEFPEPVTKACWDNHAGLSQKTATELGVVQGDVVKIELKGKSVEVPVIVQPGLAHGTVAVAIGYGREKAGKSANGVGKNIYPLASLADGFISFAPGEVTVSKTGDFREIAQTQTHNTVMNRKSVLQETVLSHFQKDPLAGRFVPKIPTSEGTVDATDLSLWNGHKYKNHSWGLVVDLNTCFGCGSCVISCQAENNIPVVGRQEIINAREMHWMRIDRYYSSDADVEDLRGLEIASENPEVTFQPMMCQHCNNAPCETVCPVLATTHSSEGLNQMAYNRCVGTRYCANNCPYKVRRFNWFKYFDNDNFDYNFNNDLGKMVINPDVTVRSRGVIEKCSMCVHLIQEAKLTAKKERRRLNDGDVTVVCGSSCPTNAITFGDMNDPESKISKLLSEEREGRAFHMLEEINVRPQVSYLTKIRNKDVVAKAEEKKEHA
ncbi:TAT-variant-translocated molybdopterin oxidoreductase [Dyadobacter bucti]|uniref:TAT-variant-translocated molybdopterin oxidoreductase n=1 Tax=Dyadobacter bucti TaxID=2572203 RepID=UPI0011096543|nr:TAT-variant-translocated molybdopterin oxidoreductase [Dyadobacter bucti]